MKHVIAAAAAALVWACAANGAAAKDIPAGGLTVQEVAAWLKAKGYRADLEQTDEGEKYVASAAEGVNFEIYMYDCKGAARCTSLQFHIGFGMESDLSVDRINSWNRENRYVKAYLDDEKDPYFQYDANLSPGGTYEALDDDLGVWLGFLPNIKSHIDW